LKNKVLIITSGSTQLITQLSVLRKKDCNFNNIFLIYNGLFNESLDSFFNQIAEFYRFTYVGQILFNLNPIAFSKKEFILYLFTNRNKKLFYLIKKKFPILIRFRYPLILIIPVRVKMLADTMLLSYLKPKSILYVADGVIDILPKRRLNNWKYFYLKNHLNSFPIKEKIFSPYYLEKDINRIGSYHEVDTKIILNEVTKIDIAKKFKNLYLKDSISHVIISQHFHLHEGITLEKDILYYKQLIKYCLQNCGDSKVIFKAHPRDVREKIDILKVYADDRLIVVSDELKSLPIEVFYLYFNKINTIFITGNSSAPLYFRKSNKIISVCSKINLHESLNKRIVEFANRYDIEYIRL
jgi:hypothetical protein